MGWVCEELKTNSMIQPLKRDKNLIRLSHDHHDGLLVCWKIRQGIAFSVEPAILAKFIVHEFDRHLAAHFMAEETWVFTNLLATDPLRITANVDHEAIRAMVHTLRQSDDLSTIERFIDRLDQHIRFEERILFTHLQQALTSDALQEIGQQLEATQPKKLTDSWNDEFWLRRAT